MGFLDSTDRIVEESTSPVDEIESEELKLQKEKSSGFLITDEEAEDEEAGLEFIIKSNKKSTNLFF